MIFKLFKKIFFVGQVLLEHPGIARKVCKDDLKTSKGDSAVHKVERAAQALRLYFQGKIFLNIFPPVMLHT